MNNVELERQLRNGSNKALQALTENISVKYFDKPFKAVTYFNGRLRTTGGRFHHIDNHIDINPKMLTEHDMDTLVGVIKHELCHYHLYTCGVDDGHNSVFKALLNKVGGSRYAPAPSVTTRKQCNKRIYHYTCEDCGHEYLKRRRMNTNKYACGICGGRINLDLFKDLRTGAYHRVV